MLYFSNYLFFNGNKTLKMFKSIYIYQNIALATEVSFLVFGITGGVVLSVYSTDLPDSGFALPRTVNATAVLLTEPDDTLPGTSISRQSSHASSHVDQSCGRPIIPLREKINFVNNVKQKVHEHISPVLSKIHQRLEKKISFVESTFSLLKAKIYNKLGLSCLVPRLIRPFEPILRYARCKIGLDYDGFMEAHPCNGTVCMDPSIEDRTITHDLGVPNLDALRLDVSTTDDCFSDMKKIQYAARVLAKIIEDQPCDDPRYESLCNDAIEQNRILDEDSCLSVRYVFSAIIYIYIYIYI